MAQSSFTKHEKETVERYMRALVTFIQPPYIHKYGEEELSAKSHSILQKLKHHRFLDTHPREVEGRVAR